ALWAFARIRGKVLWKTADGESSYSPPLPATLAGRNYSLFLPRARLLGIEPASGKILFQYPFRPPMRNSVTAATPVIVDDLIFLSASYGTGALLLKLEGNSLQKVWESDEALSNHYATSVYHDGFLFGIHGRTDPGFQPPASLRCIEWKTGKLVWEQPDFGAATLILAGGQLLILTERGELIRAPASASGFKSSARAQIMPNQVRAHPALADGLFYARSKDKLACFNLKRATPSPAPK